MQESPNECTNKWNNKSLSLSLSLFFSPFISQILFEKRNDVGDGGIGHIVLGMGAAMRSFHCIEMQREASE